MNEKTEVSSRTMIRVLGGFSFIFFVLFLYMVSAFFRTDRVWDEVSPMYWTVQAMDCKSAKSTPVLIFAENKGLAPEFALYFTRKFYAKLKPFERELVNVKKRYIGYLKEWDWGLIEFRSVAGHKVQDSWRVPPEQLTNCVLYNDDSVKDAVVKPRIRMR